LQDYCFGVQFNKENASIKMMGVDNLFYLDYSSDNNLPQPPTLLLSHFHQDENEETIY